MKTLFLISVGCLAFAIAGLSQTPSPSVSISPAPTAAMSASVSPSGSPEQSDLGDKIRNRIDKEFRHKGFHFNINDGDSDDAAGRRGHHDDVPEAVIPLVAIIFMTVFGTPILIVAVIMYFGFSRNRMMHRTIRMMVEKGQPVPPALLAPPPPAQRQRSDMRRGVVLMMVGIGLLVFLGAVNDWEGGSWAIGLIPLLIGVGYLIVWKLEGGTKPKPDNPPPLP